MPSPFPGMDPYVERPAIWPDCHDTLITCIRGALQPLLRPKYGALTQDRLFVVDSDRRMLPDVAVVPSPSTRTPSSGAMALLEPDAPTIFELHFEEEREPYLEIREAAAGHRIVTAIEVLSPDNKTAGAGRRSYLRKQEELWDSGANLVEIDLLRAGEPTMRVSFAHLDELRPWRLPGGRVAPVQQCPARSLSRHALERTLAAHCDSTRRIADQDVTLDLQAAFNRCWDEGAYPGFLHYDKPPPGRLTPEELAWCEDILRNGGYRGET